MGLHQPQRTVFDQYCWLGMFKVGVYLEDPTATLSYSATGVDPDDLDEPDAGCIDDLIKGRQHAKWRVLFKP